MEACKHVNLAKWATKTKVAVDEICKKGAIKAEQKAEEEKKVEPEKKKEDPEKVKERKDDEDLLSLMDEVLE